ncbi:MAG: formylglycine-generating enzyme family protein [Candidatus Lernaella stagnicola]|nr:formylglycine-generating enzyme family protein [Candidatus Lernaella stagnicola]
MKRIIYLAVFVAVTAALCGAVTGAGDAPKGMAAIPGGWFTMGCSPGDGECFEREKPSKRVYVDAFFIDTHEVTQAEYLHVMGDNPSHFKNCANCPVETVNWNEARRYCAKVGKRLPTEAEWEYAARGGTTGARYGDIEAVAWYDIEAVAWYRSKAGKKTHPVGQKQPNAYGLYDMLGNVYEWCEDWFDEKWYSRMPEHNPINTQNKLGRVLRGGSWFTGPQHVRASYRGGHRPTGATFNGGFRCSRDGNE